MGCGSSKTTLVRAIDTTKPPPTPKARKTSASKPRSADLDAIRKRKTTTRPDSNTSAATVAAVQMRGQSAKSTQSADSGIGLASRGDSAQASNKRLAPIGRPLTSAGISPSLAPPRIRREQPADEKKILESLKQEGLLGEKSTSTSKGGLVYEIPLDELRPATSKGPPRRLARLKLENRKKELELSKQTLKAKLDSAERRRRQREQEKVARSRDKDTKNLDIRLSLVDFDKNKQMSKRSTVDEKLQEHAQKKQEYLDGMRTKLAARERRGSRQRSQLPVGVDPLELEIMSPKPPVINIDDLPVGGPSSQSSQSRFQF
uniref:Uncharacterized protein n=1 Tax=Plectus sambesii TaxID=2011161 RepID=A0A914WWA4_9BILA